MINEAFSAITEVKSTGFKVRWTLLLILAPLLTAGCPGTVYFSCLSFLISKMLTRALEINVHTYTQTQRAQECTDDETT